MPINRAAWSETIKGKPFVVKDAPYTPPGEGELVIKNAAVAINPADPHMQDYAMIPMDWPNILGNDVAGVVEEVGPGVKGYKKGDRVIACTTQLLKGRPAEGGFQLYTVVGAAFASHLPASIPFEEGVVLPLGTITAAHGLFEADRLALSPPSVDAPKRNETVLVWGGSSSVGASATQLLRNAGYDVVATASKKNHEFVKSLGASAVIDYSSPSVLSDIAEALKGKHLAGAFDSISTAGPEGTIQKCISIILSTPGAVKRVGIVMPGSEREARDGVHVQSMFATRNFENEAARKAWQFVPVALEKGLILPKPDPEVVGHGLEAIQKAVDLMRAKVSAKKLVVTL